MVVDGSLPVNAQPQQKGASVQPETEKEVIRTFEFGHAYIYLPGMYNTNNKRKAEVARYK